MASGAKPKAGSIGSASVRSASWPEIFSFSISSATLSTRLAGSRTRRSASI
jgi:hypothetical protein